MSMPQLIIIIIIISIALGFFFLKKISLVIIFHNGMSDLEKIISHIIWIVCLLNFNSLLLFNLCILIMVQ